MAKATQNAVPDGEIELVHKIIRDDECRVAEAELVPQLTVQDVMPQDFFNKFVQVDKNIE